MLVHAGGRLGAVGSHLLPPFKAFLGVSRVFASLCALLPPSDLSPSFLPLPHPKRLPPRGMPALDTMPMPVFAASLRQPARPEAPERKDAQGRQAKLQWTEQWRLLRQKAELLLRGALPKAAPSEKELFEVVQPFLEATAALERARSTEASNAWADLRRVKQATARFRELVMHVGAGPDFVAELQEVMEGADARLRVLRQQHERRSLELHQQELALTQELEAMARSLEGPLPEVRPTLAPPNPTPHPNPNPHPHPHPHPHPNPASRGPVPEEPPAA